MNDDQIASGPPWAHGCDNCKHGIQIEPDQLVHAYTTLYLRRAIGAHLEETVFCECRAGHMSRQRARKDWTKHGTDAILKQAKRIMSQPPMAATLT